jgi:hypothetical protein
MPTIHEQAVKRHLKEVLEGEDRADWQSVLFETLKKMGNNFWWYLDAVGQKHYNGYTLEDAYAFVQVHSDISMGKVVICRVRTGGVPGSDNSVRGNNELLSSVPKPFEASFEPQTGGGADNDGWFTWNKPIKMQLHSMTDDGKMVYVKPWLLPLEVGTTAYSKTLLHIRTAGVARWPYGDEWITVFYRLPQFHVDMLQDWREE